MHVLHTLVALTALLTPTASAWEAPQFSGFQRKWEATFIGKANTPASPDNWITVNGGTNYNGEVSTYSSSSSNVRFSGSNTLQIIPLKSSSGAWTSARIESKYTITPTIGKITRIQASIRLGTNPTSSKQGIWPAFWMLGNSYRTSGTVWPACGEIDIMENINGQSSVSSTLHCDVSPGGACNENYGLTGTDPLTDGNYHVWRVDIDRRNASWQSQVINFLKDGVVYHTIRGSDVNNLAAWAALTQKPLYLILNVAVGGYYPGMPNDQTQGGNGAMMEIGYVAHYVST